MSFKNIIETDELSKLMAESPVGAPGRTSHVDADNFIDENPAIIKEFRKIIIKMGGKAVARRVLDRINFSAPKKAIEESKQDVVDYLRDVGFKIKKVYPGEQSREIEFYKATDAKEAFEDLKTAGLLTKWDITYDGVKSLMVMAI